MPKDTDLDHEIQVASSLAREAGDVILKIYQTDFTVRFKDRGEPVTEADRRASELILAGLRREFPDDLVISEEEPVGPGVPVPSRVWYVDPLDGTREFIARNGEFAVMIGLAVDGRPRLGVVLLPVTGELFAGIAEAGTWLEEAGTRVPARVSAETRPERLRLVVSRSHRHRLLDEMRAAIGAAQEIRMGSVGVKVSLLVTGQADVYVDPSNVTSAWDTCAPEALLRGAGGRMTDLAGNSLVYSPRDLRNQQGLVATNGACHEHVIAAIAPIIREAKLL